MPRFHFNVYDGVSDIDKEGVELPDWEAARAQAVRVAGQIIKDGAKRIALGEDWRLEVTDYKGLILFRMDFSILASPAAANPWPRPSDL